MAKFYKVVQLGGLTIISSSCKFRKCQKSRKSVGNRQSYCNNNQAYFFLANPVYIRRRQKHLATRRDCG